MISPMQRFFRMLSPNIKAIRNLYIFALMSGLVSLSLPLGIQAIINLIQGGQISVSWIVLVAVVLVGYLFNGGLQIIQLRITEALQRDVFVRSALEFTYRIPRIKLEALHGKYAPELMNRFFDTITIQKGMSKVLLEFATSGVQILFGLILLSFYHPFFIVFSFIFVFLTFVLARSIFVAGLKSSLKESKEKYEVAFWIEEVARTNITFRLACASALPTRQTDDLVSDYLDARDKHFNILIRHYYFYIALKILIAASFLILGGILVFNQQMNIGQFVAAEIIVLLLISSSEKLFLTMETVYDLLTSIEKISQVTDLPLEETKPPLVNVSNESGGMSVEAANVKFRYPDSVSDTLSDVSFHLQSGEKAVLTGQNGAGKSTLTKILALFYETGSGALLYNGIPINNYSVNQLRQLISECIAEDRIFNGSVIDNITLGKPYEQAEIMEVLKTTCLDRFISSLPEGFFTQIGPQGIRLPASVNQKLILARNLFRKPKFLIIEDFFRNLVPEEKKQIMHEIFRKENPQTVLFITTDPEIIAMAGVRLHMESGKITQTQTS